MNKKKRTFYFQKKQTLILVILAAALVVTLAMIGVLTNRNHVLKQQIKNNGVGIESVAAQTKAGSSLPYAKLYPDFHVGTIPAVADKKGKVVYLTFDDGPSALTYQILNELEQYHAKATFFVIGNNITKARVPLLQRMVKDGCTLGIHTQTHIYKKIYASIPAFLEDYDQAYHKIYEATGTYPTIFRFPGGSINGYDKGFYEPLIAEMLRRGFVYFDWNLSVEDAIGKKYTAEELSDHVVGKVHSYSIPVVLLHDAAEKKTTVQAVALILKELSAEGYQFEALDRSVPQVSFAYPE